MIPITILGATGYTGRVLLDLLARHPHAALAHATSTTRAGLPIAEVHPHLRGVVPGHLEAFDVATVAADSQVVFSCLPHAESMQAVKALLEANPQLNVIDLSADFRLHDADRYAATYGREHAAPDLLARAAYGLPELFRERIQATNLVANPGCYPTATLVPLAPFARAGLLTGDVVVDAKSGLSGAGATPSPTAHYAEANESVQAYKPLVHRHQPEMQQGLDALAAGLDVQFVPHLVPMTRGIHSTVYASTTRPVTPAEAQRLLEAAYASEPFVRVLPKGVQPDTKNTQGTNFVDVAVTVHPNGRRLVLTGALDNLVKGASGQAVQNLNLLTGHPETTGLAATLPIAPTQQVVA